MEMPTNESWGQPPICFYSLRSDGENMYATVLDDPYGELSCSNEPPTVTSTLPEEDVEVTVSEVPHYESLRISGRLLFWDNPEEDIY
jgi:hypothetical protein